MSEGRKGRGQKGGSLEPGPAGSAGQPGRGSPASLMTWIVTANVLALFALGLAVAAIVFQFVEEDEDGGTPAVAQPTPAVQPTATPLPAVVDVSVDDDPFIGPEDAAVTIVEFSDYQ
jgi:protein-disulfide isomerase